ncbi:MAG: HAMP domain-containing sensor histidine kinase [Hespellia sp.]|nr:HAMP domain-containing sensor histidine kinase [Hespellia sp.]
MKSILRIVRRYVGSAVFISIAIILINLVVWCYCMLRFSPANFHSYRKLTTISDQFYVENGTIQLSQEGLVLLEEQYQFGMLLDENGDIIWSCHLPTELKHTYTLADISSASKWYLDDYPVWMWNCDKGIFVTGYDKNSVWKYTLEFPQSGIKAFTFALPLCNLLLIALFSLFFGRRFYCALKPVALGIEALSLEKRISLPENGILIDLKQRLNQTSRILEQQKNLLTRRDTARTEWISGVSHDIRTPLSMIMGYADSLETDSSLTQEQAEAAAIIKQQSLRIKELIEDLNLTSKLEYQMQPLRLEKCAIAALLRELIADYYNQHLSELYEINLQMKPDAGHISLMADRTLLLRAFRNLINNSIRHNPNGCRITILLSTRPAGCQILYFDNGAGIPEPVLEAYYKGEGTTDSSSPHIMGLYLIEKIIRVHHGTFDLLVPDDRNFDVLADDLTLPQKGMGAAIVLPV